MIAGIAALANIATALKPEALKAAWQRRNQSKKTTRTVWQRLQNAMRKKTQAQRDAWIEEGRRLDILNAKVKTRQVVRARMIAEEYQSMRKYDLPRSVRRAMARDKAKRIWRERYHGTAAV